MWVAVGEKVKSSLNGTVYVVKAVDFRSVILQSENGSSQTWTNWDALGRFFEKIEGKNTETNNQWISNP